MSTEGPVATMTRFEGARAVVVGGGIAGLLAAAALSEGFEHVQVVDKDRLPENPEPRKYVPQGAHVHGILKGGEERIESLLPGMRAALLAAGGVPVRSGLDGRHYDSGEWLPRIDLGVTQHTQSRALFEHVIRAKLNERANVRIRDCTKVLEYTLKGEAVTGVVFERGGVRRTVACDLVVDATGRGNRMPHWLQRCGFGCVERSVCEMDICYVTGIFDKTPQWTGRRESRVLRPRPPDTRSGTLIPIEGDRWLLTLTGRFGDFPPTDLEGFLGFARELEDRTLHDVVAGGRLRVPISRYRIPRSVWTHYERLASFPRRLVLLGDLVGSFNPLYAQGMSQAAQHAMVLRERLCALAGDRRGIWSDTFARGCRGAMAEVTAQAWRASTVGDFAYPQTRGDRPQDLEEQLRFQRGMRSLLAHDEAFYRLVFRVRSLLEPASRLTDPAVRSRVLSAAANR